MCGVAGILNTDKKPVSSPALKRMVEAIAHRGPDGLDFYLDRFIGLGHCRLAILDLSPRGNQPMSTADGRFVITYNGEVYNYREIRTELRKFGHKFNSNTDTEVVLHAYTQWGEDCLSRFNGMFAFAVWDKKKQELFLARDRYGMKPLYYALINNTFIFASEQKAIISHPVMKQEIDLEALLEYFTFQNIFTNKTLLKGIKLFPAGNWAKVLPGTVGLETVPYWDFHFQEPTKPASDAEYIEELDRLFHQAVKRQLVSDVEIGSYLSGGIDSGAVTAIAAGQLPYIKTFTCGFDLHSASGLELGFDERRRAEFMSYLFKTEHYEMVLKSGDMERILPEFAWYLEEPRIGQSYPNYYIAQLASKFVKVVLTGAAGDELFGGYPWRYYHVIVNNDFEQYIDKYYAYWQRLIPNQDIRSVFAPVWPQVKHIRTRDIFRDVFKKHANKLASPADYVNHSLYFEAKTFLHSLLVVEDKLSMAHSLETRVPFLDNDLVDFAMQIPVKLKLRNLKEVIRLNENEPGLKASKYYEKTRDGKLILRKVMNKYIPPRITTAVKQGFSAPDASWFKGESIEYVKNLLYDKRARLYNYLDRKSVQHLVEEHLNGTQNRRLFIWSLLNFEWWCRKYLETK
ncbi:MAG: asparagine synthase (glutamine-hydrolyzing) [bacterium]|jgi:asparagine synthase (glutamine-hydrolysing)|nr:asparagine synthase (glutamine-hydrolyzing) [bacterium]